MVTTAWDHLRLARDALDPKHFDNQVFNNLIHRLNHARRFDNTVFTLGNGGSAANALHLSCHMTDVGINSKCINANPVEFSAYCNDNTYEKGPMFILDRARQGDVIFSLSSSGLSPNVTQVLSGAYGKLIRVAMWGNGRESEFADFNLSHPSTNPAVVEDVHSVLIHMIKAALTVR